MAELTWVAKTSNTGRIYHVAESKSGQEFEYEVWPSNRGDFFIQTNNENDDFDPLDSQYYQTVVEAKQVCQRHEDSLAERGLACGPKEATP